MSVKRIKNTGDYYVAGRTLGPFVLTATVCASIIGGSAMMGRAGIAYTTGFKAVMTAIPYLIGMFIFSAIAGRIQEVGFTRNINSIPELFNYINSTARCILALAIVSSQPSPGGRTIKMLGNGSASAMKPAPWRPSSSSSRCQDFGVVYTTFQFFMHYLVCIIGFHVIGRLFTMMRNLQWP